MLLVSGMAHAQQNDPTIMTINGQPGKILFIIVPSIFYLLLNVISLFVFDRWYYKLCGPE